MLNRSRTLRLFVTAGAALTVAAFLFSADLAAAAKGSETKGRAYYRQICRDCHLKGAKGGEVSPLTKTQAQWRTYFQKGKHTAAEPLGKYLNESQTLDVQTFLINHAADSPQPETCGK
jgi:mono/diheme cytochrome c family protein